jgi:molybdopterin/thiamine biosynthesis adenylyltransferase
MLEKAEKKYYSRQILQQEIGENGQDKLKQARVVCVGAGAIASASLTYLAGMGIGYIRIIDADTIAEHNLHRQIMYQFSDIDKKKVERAKSFLSLRNPNILIETIDEFLTEKNAIYILKNVDLILDASDNQEARKIINDYSIKNSVPFLFTAVQDFQLQYALVNPSLGPCLNCFVDLKTSSTFSCAESGILNIVPGMAGLMQAQLVFRFFMGNFKSKNSDLYLYNLLNANTTNFKIEKNPNCHSCNKIKN